MPYLPRLESIFRDPRLPFLTSFSLASFVIGPDSVETLLAYMPALKVRELEMVDGVNEVLKGLEMTRVSKDGKTMVVKNCLKLEEIRFGGCDKGFDMERWKKVVSMRSGMLKNSEETNVSAPSTNSTKNSAARTPGGEVRKIKPLKRSAGGSWNGMATQAGLPAGDGEEVTRIKRVKVARCQSVTEESAKSMEYWGTVVEWTE